ncbi:sideroflexin-1-3-like [Drosophila albomicans]|uniref:Sidoreflexin n=1 Tax=Drosophila albomicans TaxID=7291 RepID=A0A6P8XM35_DROAB|nr:sideroflexin-1-3-like [Drosophila albomicans]
MSMGKVDIDKPKYDQSTYWGRCKHFFLLTNPANLLTSSSQLDEAKDTVEKYRSGKLRSNQSIDEVWKSKYLYDSAFHPETGEKQFLLGRMSAQMPMNTLLTAGMLIFYQSTKSVVFWQWLNQTFNATVNYTNRSGKTPISKPELLTSYTLATSGALGTALGLNHLVKSMNPLIGRLVPLVAVAAANCINIPCMRRRELRDGVSLLDDQNHEVGVSKKAAAQGISNVVVSRISMAIPGMTLTPLLIEYLEKSGFLKRYPHLTGPIQILSCAFILLFSTPMGCAFFQQISPIKVDKLEPEVKESIKRAHPGMDTVYFNKGL